MVPLRNAVFVDTSGWVEPVLRTSPNYAEMARFAHELRTHPRPTVTTDDVLNEVVALLTTDSRGIARPKLIEFVNRISAMPHVRVIHIDEPTWAEGWAMLEQMPHKEWSFVDATSIIVMRRLGITEAFTSDKHFSQAGLLRVPT